MTKSNKLVKGGRLAFCLASVLILGASAAAAQIPGGTPPQGEGPGSAPMPPGIGGFILPDPKSFLTPAQRVVADLTPPEIGLNIPSPPLGPDAPMPSSDPRDFNGTWYHNQGLVFRIQDDMYGNPLPYNDTGAAVMARRVKSLDTGPYLNASSVCFPMGPQWQTDLNMPFQIFQSDKTIEFVFEEYHGAWNITLDPVKAPLPDKGRTYMGNSVGHWAGDTLVVETSGFKHGMWLTTDGTPLSADSKMTLRIRKVNSRGVAPYIEVVTTYDDPTFYTHPWSIVRTWGWAPDKVYPKEYNCEEQVGDPEPIDAGMVPEPFGPSEK